MCVHMGPGQKITSPCNHCHDFTNPSSLVQWGRCCDMVGIPGTWHLSKLFHAVHRPDTALWSQSKGRKKNTLHDKGFDELFTVLSVNVLITCPFTLYKIKFTYDEPGRWLMTGCGMNNTLGIVIGYPFGLYYYLKRSVVL